MKKTMILSIFIASTLYASTEGMVEAFNINEYNINTNTFKSKKNGINAEFGAAGFRIGTNLVAKNNFKEFKSSTAYVQYTTPRYMGVNARIRSKYSFETQLELNTKLSYMPKNDLEISLESTINPTVNGKDLKYKNILTEKSESIDYKAISHAYKLETKYKNENVEFIADLLFQHIYSKHTEEKTDKIKQLEDRIKMLEKVVPLLEKKKELSDKVTELENKLKIANNKDAAISKIEKDIQDKKNTYDSQKAEQTKNIETLKTETTNLEKTKTEKEQEKVKKENEKKDLEQKIQKLEQELADAQRKETEAKTAKEHAEQEYSSLEQEIQKIENQKQEIENKLNEEKEKKVKAEQEFNEIKLKKEKTDRINDQKLDEIDKKFKNISDETEKAKLKKQMEEIYREDHNNKEELDNKKNELEKLTNIVNEKEKDKTRLEQEIQTKKQKLDIKMQEKQRAEQEYQEEKNKEAQREQKQQDLNAKKQELTEKQNAYETAKQQFEQAEENYDSKNNELNALQQDMEVKEREHEAQIQKLNKDKADVEEDFNKKDQFSSELAEKKKEVEANKAEIEKLDKNSLTLEKAKAEKEYQLKNKDKIIEHYKANPYKVVSNEFYFGTKLGLKYKKNDFGFEGNLIAGGAYKEKEKDDERVIEMYALSKLELAMNYRVAVAPFLYLIPEVGGMVKVDEVDFKKIPEIEYNISPKVAIEYKPIDKFTFRVEADVKNSFKNKNYIDSVVNTNLNIKYVW